MNGLDILGENGKRSIYDGKFYENCLSRRIWHRLVCFVNEWHAEIRTGNHYIRMSFSDFVKGLPKIARHILSHDLKLQNAFLSLQSATQPLVSLMCKAYEQDRFCPKFDSFTWKDYSRKTIDSKWCKLIDVLSETDETMHKMCRQKSESFIHKIIWISNFQLLYNHFTLIFIKYDIWQ